MAHSPVRKKIFLDGLAVGLEQNVCAAQLTDLLVGPLDHAVALAGLLIKHLAARRDLESLLGAGLGLDFGHSALLCQSPLAGRAGFAHVSLKMRRRYGSRREPGAASAGLWQSAAKKTTK